MSVLKYIIVILILLFCYEIYQRYGLEVTSYKIQSNKIKNAVRIVVFSDLHGFQMGRDNSGLIARIEAQKPELILIPGDLITKEKEATEKTAEELCKKLVRIAPVCVSFGNHDMAMYRHCDRVRALFSSLQKEGVVFLNNERISQFVGGNAITVYGLSLPMEVYNRRNSKPVTEEDLQILRAQREPNENFSILLAHTPAGEKAYMSFQPDLIVCGHYHGGILRIGNTGLITPQLEWLTNRAHGLFLLENSKMIVTSGLGVHAIPFRVFNRPEIVVLDIQGE